MTKVVVFSSKRHSTFQWYPPVDGWPNFLLWAHYLNFGDHVEIVESFDAYKQAKGDIKIAFDIVDWTTGESAFTQEHSYISELCRISDHCFITDTELYQPSFLIGRPIKSDNITWIIPGTCEWQPAITWQYHLQRIADLDANFDYNINYTDPRHYYFDALMGAERPHRLFVDSQIFQHSLQDKFIKTLYSVHEPHASKKNIKTFTSVGAVDFSHQTIQLQGISTPLCNIVPYEIYNQTAYSLITETGALNGAHMLTEKIAKASLGHRLFVVFAGAGYLQHLKDQGFQTFDGIIDETYDLIHDDRIRWTAAFEQVQWLCSQSQSDILNKVKHIVEYNYNHAHTNFNQLAIDSIQEKINQLIL